MDSHSAPFAGPLTRSAKRPPTPSADKLAFFFLFRIINEAQAGGEDEERSDGTTITRLCMQMAHSFAMSGWSRSARSGPERPPGDAPLPAIGAAVSRLQQSHSTARHNATQHATTAHHTETTHREKARPAHWTHTVITVSIQVTASRRSRVALPVAVTVSQSSSRAVALADCSSLGL